MGGVFETRFGVGRVAEAGALWQWWNCAASHVLPGFVMLRINLDETSISFFQGNGKGAVAFRKRKQSPSEEPVQSVARSTKRSCLTHIGLVCDRPDLQPRLPQVIIGNEHQFQAREMPALMAACPPNVHLIRQKSAWNNADVCKRVIQLLGAALRAYFDPLLSKRLQLVLLLDACRVHLSSAIATACLAQGIWPIIVPARLTWLFQPLDTHAFLRYKAYLRTAYQLARIATADGELSMAQFLQVLYETIRKVLQGHRWARAFDENGLGQVGGEGLQAQVSKYIQRHLGLTNAPTVSSATPAEEVLKQCYPKRAKVPSRIVLRPYRGLGQPMAAGRLALPVGRPFGLHRWRGRGAVHLRGAAPAAARAVGPQTRSQGRLMAALARGRPFPLPRAPGVNRRGG